MSVMKSFLMKKDQFTAWPGEQGVSRFPGGKTRPCNCTIILIVYDALMCNQRTL